MAEDAVRNKIFEYKAVSSKMPCPSFCGDMAPLPVEEHDDGGFLTRGTGYRAHREATTLAEIFVGLACSVVVCKKWYCFVRNLSGNILQGAAAGCCEDARRQQCHHRVSRPSLQKSISIPRFPQLCCASFSTLTRRLKHCCIAVGNILTPSSPPRGRQPNVLLLIANMWRVVMQQQCCWHQDPAVDPQTLVQCTRTPRPRKLRWTLCSWSSNICVLDFEILAFRMGLCCKYRRVLRPLYQYSKLDLLFHRRRGGGHDQASYVFVNASTRRFQRINCRQPSLFCCRATSCENRARRIYDGA